MIVSLYGDTTSDIEKQNVKNTLRACRKTRPNLINLNATSVFSDKFGHGSQQKERKKERKKWYVVLHQQKQCNKLLRPAVIRRAQYNSQKNYKLEQMFDFKTSPKYSTNTFRVVLKYVHWKITNEKLKQMVENKRPKRLGWTPFQRTYFCCKMSLQQENKTWRSVG